MNDTKQVPIEPQCHEDCHWRSFETKVHHDDCPNAERAAPAPQAVQRKITCHASGDRCHGCKHYQGKADVCEYATPQATCEHDWKWQDDYYGDPDVPGGTKSCPFRYCSKCGAEDHGEEQAPPVQALQGLVDLIKSTPPLNEIYTKEEACVVDETLTEVLITLESLLTLEQGEWLPIESAPKEECVLVAFDEPFFGTFTKEVEVAYYDSHSNKWRFTLTDREIKGGGVTHWKHLSEPPKDKPVGGCGYQGHEFGADYPDSICGTDGYLWDADSGDSPEALSVGGEIPCPECNRKKWLEYTEPQDTQEGEG